MTQESRRDTLNQELMLSGWCVTDVASEFDWKNVRRLARAIAKRHGIRVHTHLAQSKGETDWPRPFFVWDPDRKPSEADHRRAAMALDAFLRRGLPPR